jgi:hypothetical protein
VRFLLVAFVALAPLWGQIPRVATIDLYGARKISRERILKQLKLEEGDRLPASKGDLEERLEELSGVVAAHVEALCCSAGGIELFIGIEEKGAPHFAYHSQPAGSETLPPPVVETYRALVQAMDRAGRRGKLAQDLTQGHALMADPEGRALQEKLRSYAAGQLKFVRNVLRNAADDEQRAIAATVIGYAPDKRQVIDDILYAIQDPDQTVRANAVRSLEALAVLARLKPHLGLAVSPTWLIEMLNSISLSDRQRAAAALVTLTETNAEKTLQQIRERAWDSVLEMARWKSLRNAVPAYVLLGRMAGMSEQDIEKSWTGDREAAIEAIADPRKPRR